VQQDKLTQTKYLISVYVDYRSSNYRTFVLNLGSMQTNKE